MRSKILPYVRQPDAFTCQSAAIAQMIGSKDVATIRADLVRNGIAGDPANMGRYLKPRVREYDFVANGSLMLARDALDEGYKCITHGWFTRSGHVVNIKGWEPDPRTLSYRFVIDDPWCEFDFPGWRYLHHKSGDNVRYSSYGMYAACVASSSVANAHRIYRRGELDSNMKNMWLHLIKN